MPVPHQYQAMSAEPQPAYPYAPPPAPASKKRRSPYERRASPPPIATLPTHSESPSSATSSLDLSAAYDMARDYQGGHMYAPPPPPPAHAQYHPHPDDHRYDHHTQYAPQPFPITYGAPGGCGSAIQVVYTDDAATKLSDHVRRRCFNCCTTDTSTWRRSNLSPGKVLCNKCGLFERTHSRPRPEQFPHTHGPLASSTLRSRSPLQTQTTYQTPPHCPPPGPAGSAPYPPPSTFAPAPSTNDLQREDTSNHSSSDCEDIGMQFAITGHPDRSTSLNNLATAVQTRSAEVCRSSDRSNHGLEATGTPASSVRATRNTQPTVHGISPDFHGKLFTLTPSTDNDVYDTPFSEVSPVIYWPQNSGVPSDPETDASPKPTSGLEEFLAMYPNGATTASIHQPAQPLAWLESSYNLPVLNQMRVGGTFCGPVPMQLFPEVSALAIFGPRDHPGARKMAQALADASNFPVIVYSSDEDPTLGFDAEDADLIEAFNTLAEEDTVDANETTDGNSHSGDEGKLCELAPGDGGNDPGGRRDSQGPPGGGGEGLPGGGGGDEGPPGGGGGGEGPPGRGGGGEGPSGGGDSGEGPPGGGDGGNPDSGGAGPGADEDPWGDWEDGPTHLTSLGIRLKFEKTVLVQVNCNTQFKTHEKPNPFLTPIHMEHEGATEKRQAEIHVGVIVQTPKMYVLVRRSFAVLGLLVDREDAIIQNSRINVGYSPPDQLLKEVSAENRQHQVGVNASYAGGHPTAGLSYAYTSGKTNTYETQNRTNLPPAEVLSDMGDIWEPEGKTYRSASYSYMSQGRGDPSNLSAGFGFGVDFSDSVSLEDVPLPRVSGVQRHQIFLWIRNPKAKSGVRVQGIIVLLNSIIPDIRRKSQLQWRAKFDVDATSGQASNAQRTSRAEERAHYFDLAAPAVMSHRSHDIMGKLRKRSILSVQYNPVILYKTLGWDERNQQIRNPLYTDLTKIFSKCEGCDSILIEYPKAEE